MDISINPQALRSKALFKRCVECDPVSTASCPPCASPNVCILTSATCQSCPEYLCQSANVAGTVDPKNAGASSSPAPQIAGGVVGGIFVIALLVFIIWKFVLKGRRHAAVEEWDPTDYPLEKPGTMASIRDSRSRASTHTVESVATTVLTRASNVIQIAYIPGVTNRQASTPQSSTSSTHIPVPPVPIPTNPPSELSATASGQFLFLPSDLRDSTYTDLSELDAATRKSISPSLARQSYASTVFHQESAMPTAVFKAKPSLVSVSKSSTSSSPCPTPPVPAIDPKKFGAGAGGAKPVLLQIPMASENGKKAPSTLATATPMKAKALFITKNKGGADRGSASTTSTAANALKPGRIASVAESQTTMGSPHTRAKQFGDDDSSDDDDGSGHERSRRSLLKRDASPFGDHAAADFTDGTLAIKSKTKGESPFGDDHAL